MNAVPLSTASSMDITIVCSNDVDLAELGNMLKELLYFSGCKATVYD